MKARAFSLLVCVSLLALLLLACGYTTHFGVRLQRALPAPAGASAVPPTTAPVRNIFRRYTLRLDYGRACLVSETWSNSVPAHNWTLNWDAARWPPHAPQFRRSIWEFDAHSIPVPAPSRLFLLACPIWCLALPWLIAPTLWLSRRLQSRRTRKGFELSQQKSDTERAVVES